ncbi:MAG: tRNA (adenosine(37)-N6)-threonylcarbamoyltransferase complex ATPase subunit type 1 TsaE [Pseudomonadota bacterium]
MAEHSLTLEQPEATTALAEAFAAQAAAGETFLLEGPVGAGKSHFARSFIRWHLAKAGRVEDIPSPTFTLVQTYEGDGVTLWHTDLYRLDGPDELEELGLTDAFETAICLVEWPDRLGAGLVPKRHLHLSFAQGDHENARTVRMTPGPDWPHALPTLPRAREP